MSTAAAVAAEHAGHESHAHSLPPDQYFGNATLGKIGMWIFLLSDAFSFGGLLLGYGARLAYGCNIGAYFSGIASASVHGWLWLAAAFVGSVLGTYLRPLFGLSVEGNLTRAQAGPVARD